MTDLFSIRSEWNEERAMAQQLLKEQEACTQRRTLIERRVREALHAGQVNPIDFVSWGTDGLAMLRAALWNKLSLKECGRRWRAIKKLAAAQCDTLLRERDAAVSAARNCANAARVAELEQWKESAMRVLGEHHGALQRHGTLGESTADCMDRLARQVAALVAALRHAVQRNHAPSAGCDGCLGIDAALRAAGRKT